MWRPLLVLGLVAESAAFLAPSVGLQSRTALPLSSLRNVPRAEARSSVISLQSSAEDAVSSAGRRQLIIGAGLALMGIPQVSLADESYLEELAGSDGMAVAVSFQVPKKWDLERKPGSILVNDQTQMACDADPDKCTQGDLTIKPKAGADGAFLVVRSTADSLEAMTPDFIKKSVFNRGGKFGAFGAPEDVKFVKDKVENGVRLIDVKFNAFSPGGTTIARKGILAVSKAGPEAYVWVATTSATRWKNSEETLRNIAGSFSAKSTGQKAKVEAKFNGVKKSMFNKENEERARLERERAAEGIQ